MAKASVRVHNGKGRKHGRRRRRNPGMAAYLEIAGLALLAMGVGAVDLAIMAWAAPGKTAGYAVPVATAIGGGILMGYYPRAGLAVVGGSMAPLAMGVITKVLTPPKLGAVTGRMAAVMGGRGGNQQSGQQQGAVTQGAVTAGSVRQRAARGADAMYGG